LVLVKIFSKLYCVGAFGLAELGHAEKGEVDSVWCPHQLHLVIIISLYQLFILVIRRQLRGVVPALDVDAFAGPYKLSIVELFILFRFPILLLENTAVD
jgi:hypothetical protein